MQYFAGRRVKDAERTHPWDNRPRSCAMPETIPTEPLENRVDAIIELIVLEAMISQPSNEY